MKLFACILPVILLFDVAIAATKVDVVQLSEETYRLTLTSDAVIPVAVAQQELAPYAAELCGAGVPEFGEYRFEQTEAISEDASSQNEAFVLVQEIACKAATPPAITGKTRTLGEADRAAIERSVQNLTEEYFRNIDDSDFAASYAKLSPTMTGRSYDDWKANMESFRSMSGPRHETSIWRITIYVDPPEAPGPGIYVAADFENSYENVPFQCGYLIWLEGPAGDFLIIREETGHVDSQSVSGLSKAELQQVKAAFGCHSSEN